MDGIEHSQAIKPKQKTKNENTHTSSILPKTRGLFLYTQRRNREAELALAAIERADELIESLNTIV